ncbi:rod-determining factor RdfA [Haladaptatus sp. CMSO5]|uniref:rod-determining factor RdfA n=1 Tax=Haladaptatus sp. CMSO5 TaxID=3120514 RepID=UPI002FCE375F
MANTNESEDGTRAGRRSKVHRKLAKYGLDDMGEELAALWTATGDDHWSLRDLADRANRAMLKQAMTDAGMQPVDDEVATAYQVLTNDDTSSGDKLRIERRLKRQQVPIDDLTRDFVSYQAVRTYLTKVRGVEYDRDHGDRLERESQNIQKLRGRTETVTQSKLAQLRNTDRLSLGEFRVMVSVRVFCEDCGGQYEVAELLDDGACDCETTD